jgi:23S rRNA (guanosine2251-2'-O)-methyltransferase
MDELLLGWNAVLDALEAGRRPLDRVFLARGRGDSRARRLRALARERGVPVIDRPARRLDEMAGGQPHQGVVALAAPVPWTDLADCLEAARTPLLVALDGVEDPRNLGAVLRTAAAAGADGVVLPERRSAGLTPAATRAAAGAVERISLIREKNLSRALEGLRKRGLWVVGLDAGGDTPWDRVDWTLPTVLVVGGEGRGLRPGIRKHCDIVARIPLAAGMESLNLSVAAAVVLYEAVRQRAADG